MIEILDTAFHLFLCGMGLFAIRAALKSQREAQKQTKVAMMWCKAFTDFVIADTINDESEKHRICTRVSSQVMQELGEKK